MLMSKKPESCWLVAMAAEAMSPRWQTAELVQDSGMRRWGGWKRGGEGGGRERFKKESGGAGDADVAAACCWERAAACVLFRKFKCVCQRERTPYLAWTVLLSCWLTTPLIYPSFLFRSPRADAGSPEHPIIFEEKESELERKRMSERTTNYCRWFWIGGSASRPVRKAIDCNYQCTDSK